MCLFHAQVHCRRERDLRNKERLPKNLIKGFLPCVTSGAAGGGGDDDAKGGGEAGGVLTVVAAFAGADTDPGVAVVSIFRSFAPTSTLSSTAAYCSTKTPASLARISTLTYYGKFVCSICVCMS